MPVNILFRTPFCLLWRTFTSLEHTLSYTPNLPFYFQQAPSLSLAASNLFDLQQDEGKQHTQGLPHQTLAMGNQSKTPFPIWLRNCPVNKQLAKICFPYVTKFFSFCCSHLFFCVRIINHRAKDSNRFELYSLAAGTAHALFCRYHPCLQPVTLSVWHPGPLNSNPGPQGSVPAYSPAFSPMHKFEYRRYLVGGRHMSSSVTDLFHEHCIFPDSLLPLHVPEFYSDMKQNCILLCGYTVHDRSRVLTDGHIGCSAFRPLPGVAICQCMVSWAVGSSGKCACMCVCVCVISDCWSIHSCTLYPT